MIRVFVLYESEPDPERYAIHAEHCRRVPGAAFRHGRVVRTLAGEPRPAYYGEFEFSDMEAFKVASATDEFRATGADAAEIGIPHSVHLAEVNP